MKNTLRLKSRKRIVTGIIMTAALAIAAAAGGTAGQQIIPPSKMSNI
jgi:hypothetical protein